MSEVTMSTQELDGPTVAIELAKVDDAEAIAELLRLTWMDTYPNEEAGITKEDIRLRTEGKNGERIPQNIQNWRKKIESNDGLGAVFVARADGKVVGLAAPGFIEGKRHVGALYVLPETQGSGIGGKLMQKILDWHNGNENDIYLRVASYNQNAIDFYKRFRFEQTNNSVIDEGNVYGKTYIPEIEMMRKAK